MSDLKHTPEPWAFHKSENTSSFGLYYGKKYIGIGTCQSRISYLPEDRANAARIVACVNACAGKPNPERWIKEAESMLQKIYDFEHTELKLGQSKLEFILKLASERDKLLNALIYLVNCNTVKSMESDIIDAVDKARAVIDKARGGKP